MALPKTKEHRAAVIDLTYSQLTRHLGLSDHFKIVASYQGFDEFKKDTVSFKIVGESLPPAVEGRKLIKLNLKDIQAGIEELKNVK